MRGTELARRIICVAFLLFHAQACLAQLCFTVSAREALGIYTAVVMVDTTIANYPAYFHSYASKRLPYLEDIDQALPDGTPESEEITTNCPENYKRPAEPRVRDTLCFLSIWFRDRMVWIIASPVTAKLPSTLPRWGLGSVFVSDTVHLRRQLQYICARTGNSCRGLFPAYSLPSNPAYFHPVCIPDKYHIMEDRHTYVPTYLEVQPAGGNHQTYLVLCVNTYVFTLSASCPPALRQGVRAAELRSTYSSERDEAGVLQIFSNGVTDDSDPCSMPQAAHEATAENLLFTYLFVPIRGSSSQPCLDAMTNTYRPTDTKESNYYWIVEPSEQWVYRFDLPARRDLAPLEVLSRQVVTVWDQLFIRLPFVAKDVNKDYIAPFTYQFQPYGVLAPHGVGFRIQTVNNIRWEDYRQANTKTARKP